HRIDQEHHRALVFDLLPDRGGEAIERATEWAIFQVSPSLLLLGRRKSVSKPAATGSLGPARASPEPAWSSGAGATRSARSPRAFRSWPTTKRRPARRAAGWLAFIWLKQVQHVGD